MAGIKKTSRGAGKADMEKHRYNPGPLLILLAGCFWGSMGIFVRKLGEYGFSSVQIAAIRLTLAAVGFSVILLME